jgi:hypothetical protein
MEMVKERHTVRVTGRQIRVFRPDGSLAMSQDFGAAGPGIPAGWQGWYEVPVNELYCGGVLVPDLDQWQQRGYCVQR